jgi:hypothetical protein
VVAATLPDSIPHLREPDTARGRSSCSIWSASIADSWFRSRRLYAGNNLDKARRLFAEAIKHRPQIPAGNLAADARVLQQWPQ